MADKVITSTGDCSACCGACYLTMPTDQVDGTTSNYADATAAAAAIADQAVGCLVEFFSGAASFATASATSTDLDITDASTNQALFAFQLAAGGDVKLDYAISTDADSERCVLQILDSDGVTVVGSDSDTGSTAGTLSVTLSSSGFYYGFITYDNRPASDPGTYFDTTLTAYSTVGITFCGIRAAYDDGLGGTDYVVCA